ncbi:MAG TPA: DUF3344 domain-containing protein [Methanoculleus sp.]|nr:DUF3344 domain-containing protein [Methanoculleus sp.]
MRARWSAITTFSFSVSDLQAIQAAELYTLLLASTRGQPDYVLFNSHDLGKEAEGEGYPQGARDIGDETSFNAGLYDPVDSRYVDMEVFDVLSLLRKGDNTVTFQRGRDLDGDGEIATIGELVEGEDYLHPVLVLLTLEKRRTTASGPDLVLERIEVQDSYEGENASIILNIRNMGAFPATHAEVEVRIDDALLATRQVAIDRSGIQQVSIPWKPQPGSYTIRARVDIQGDVDSSNNRKEKEIVVGTFPDLAVSLEEPYRPGTAVQQGDPVIQILIIGAALPLASLLFSRRRPHRGDKMLSVLACALILITVMPPPVALISPATGQDTSALSLLPVTVTNLGGSDASSFQLSVYLDGERVIKKEYPAGLKAGLSERSELPLFTSPGSHALRVVIDEEKRVKDADRSNNMAEATYVFS